MRPCPGRRCARSRRSVRPRRNRPGSSPAWPDSPAPRRRRSARKAPRPREKKQQSSSSPLLLESGGHHLAALDQAVLVRAVIGHGVVDRADVLPHQDVALLPVKGVAVLGSELVLEQERERALAFLLRQLVDP